jgi:phosphorylcholine metabolism protein LicD
MIKKIKLLIEKNQRLANIMRYIYRQTIFKYKQYKNNRNFRQNATYVMEHLNKVFNELGVKYWLVYGTLLGVYRDGKFIEHDDDIDIGLFLDDYSENIKKVMNKYGFKLKREILIDNGDYGREETYELKGIDIDLFYFIKKEDYFLAHDFKNEDGKSWAKTIQDNGGLIVRERRFTPFSLKEIEFLNKKFYIPYPTKEHLASVYGDDFMIPNPSWNPYNEPKNIKILKNKIGKVISYE